MKRTLTAIALVLGLATQAHAQSDQYWSDHYRLMDLEDQLDELQEDRDQAIWDRINNGYAAPPVRVAPARTTNFACTRFFYNGVPAPREMVMNTSNGKLVAGGACE